MIDKIQSNLLPNYTESINNVKGQVEVSNEKLQQPYNPSVEVSLSGDAKVLQRVIQAVQDAPDVRNDVIQTIQKQIETGSYQVNADTLAGQLLPLLN